MGIEIGGTTTVEAWMVGGSTTRTQIGIHRDLGFDWGIRVKVWVGFGVI